MSSEGVIRGAASRARVSPSLFAGLRERFGIQADSTALDLGGSSNLNLLVSAAGERHVVRVYRPWVMAERLNDMQRVRQQLAAHDIPCAVPLRTLDGDSWMVVDDRLVEVEPYCEYDAKMDSWERLEAGLPLLGRIHSELSNFGSSAAGRNAPASNNLDPPDVLPAVERGIQRLKHWNPTSGELEVASAALELARRVDQAQRPYLDLPRQMVHGDFWDNNVLFRGGKVVLVADFDFMGERTRIDDLALTLYYTNSTFADDPISDRRIRQLLRLVNAYETGLSEPLTRSERAALPLALARIPLTFIAMLPALESEAAGRQLAGEMQADLRWALAIARDPARWQAAFTRPA